MTAHSELVARLEGALTEVEGAMLGLSLLPDDFAALEALWPKGKRGSRAQTAYDTIKGRIEGITAYTRDAASALRAKEPQPDGEKT